MDNQNNGVICILDLPAGSSVVLDGVSQVFRGDGVVAMSEVPISMLHLLVVSAPTSSSSTLSPSSSSLSNLSAAVSRRKRPRRNDSSAGDRDEDDSSTATEYHPDSAQSGPLHPVGFFLHGTQQDGAFGRGGAFVCRFDESIEEVSPVSPNDLTFRNLVAAIRLGSFDAKRLIPYPCFMAQAQARHSSVPSSWVQQIDFLPSPAFLIERRHISLGEKIVPATTAAASERPVTGDAGTVQFPPIPCISSSDGSNNENDKNNSGRAVKCHTGTRQYMALLEPSQRTRLCLPSQTATTPSDAAFLDVLERHYDSLWQHLVADVQLSFLLFLHLKCWAAFEHWRDLIAMVSFTSPHVMAHHTTFFAHFLSSVASQLSFIDKDFFQDVDYSAGSFFEPSLNRLLQLGTSTATDATAVGSLGSVMVHRFHLQATTTDSEKAADSDCDSDGELLHEHVDATPLEHVEHGGVLLEQGVGAVEQGDTEKSHNFMDESDDMQCPIHSDSDDDGPVVVPLEEVVASEARALSPQFFSFRREQEEQFGQSYPLLFAAAAPQEDLAMTCARVLHDKLDVSLVREAASYLEEVEAKNQM